MKKQLIFFLIIAIAGLTALTNWSELSYRAYISEAEGDVDIITGATQNAEEKVGNELKSGINWRHELSHRFKNGLDLTLENNLFWSQKSQEYRNSYLYNFGKLDVKYFSGDHYFKLQYSNRFYDHNETRLLNIGGVDYRTQQQMVHNASLQYKGSWKELAAEFYTGFRSVDYQYYIEDLLQDSSKDDDEDDDDEEDDAERKQSWENDLYSNAEISYRIQSDWKLHTGIYYKNDLNAENWFNETRTSLGIEYFRRFDFFNILKADFTYFREDSERLDSEQADNFSTSIRYSKRIGTDLAGFISLQNLSCYDSNLNKLLRISSLVRISAKYTFGANDLKDSFLQLGIKYNPENNGSLISSSWNQKISGNLYSVLAAKYGPDLYTKVGGRLEYFLNADRSFWIQEEYSDYVDWPSEHLISIGTTIIF